MPEKGITVSKTADTPRPMYIISMLDVARVRGRLEDTFDLCKDRYNFHSDSMELLTDWCITEMIREALANLNTSVMHHYCNDEGKVLYSEFKNEFPVESQIVIYDDTYRYKPFARDTIAKVMGMGDMFIVGFQTK